MKINKTKINSPPYKYFFVPQNLNLTNQFYTLLKQNLYETKKNLF